ncbi:hypothetical protein [Bradyrhizobium liaoningense]|uniref:hypothetical protein n=1 Tax=Bradyrhizobium liaoningense TaxID=43992 RepID=UPI001BAE393B|nr:hypothetical protein [Bradyrhizobium liaoningense]MBR0988345.1 hypothetical protein [Bradyrhizobium liaoningense]
MENLMSGSTIDPAMTRTVHQPSAQRTAQAETTPAKKSAGISGVQSPPPAVKPQPVSTPAGASKVEEAITSFLDHHYGLAKEFAEIEKHNVAKQGKSDPFAPFEAEKKKQALAKDAELKAKALELASDQVTLAKEEYQRLYADPGATDAQRTNANHRVARAEELANKLTPAGIAADAGLRLTAAIKAAARAEQDHIDWLKSDHDPKTPNTNAATDRIRRKAVEDANDVIRYATHYLDQQKAAAAAGGATGP